jgi:ABC-type polysaccharide/polyol phosphate export permease
MKSFIEGLKDINSGLKRHELWRYLALNDIQSRYSRSFLGPLWVVLSTLTFLIAAGTVYSFVLKVDLNTYFPYIVVSYLIWSTYTTITHELASSVIASGPYILNSSIPISTFSFRVVWRNLILILHLIPIWLATILIFDLKFSLKSLLFIPGILIALVSASCYGTILGIVSARFRDAPMLVLNVLQIAFFVTPIMWKTDILTVNQKWVVEMNPLLPFIELIRNPLLNNETEVALWAKAITIMTVGLLLLLFTLGRYKRKVPFWL